MNPADQLRSLVAYNRYANERILDAAAGLSDEDAERGGGASFASVYGTLTHILTAQSVWLRRWSNGESGRMRGAAWFDELRDEFARSHDELDVFARDLAAEDWDREISYRDSGGNDRAEPLGLLITHCVNHGTYHRGELSALLGQFDRSPGDLDYVLFMRAMAGPERQA